MAEALACQSVLVGFLSVSMAAGRWRAVSPQCLLPPCLRQVHCKRALCNIGRTLPSAALSSAKIRQSCLPCNIPGCKNLCKRLHSAVPPRVFRGCRLSGGACLHICLWCRPLPGVAPSACEKGRLGWPYGPFCGLAGAVLQGAAVGPGLHGGQARAWKKPGDAARPGPTARCGCLPAASPGLLFPSGAIVVPACCLRLRQRRPLRPLLLSLRATSPWAWP